MLTTSGLPSSDRDRSILARNGPARAELIARFPTASELVPQECVQLLAVSVGQLLEALEMNPDKLATCIGAAEQAIAQRESLVDTTELERRKLADARSMLKSLSRIASEGKRAASETALQPRQRLG